MLSSFLEDFLGTGKESIYCNSFRSVNNYIKVVLSLRSFTFLMALFSRPLSIIKPISATFTRRLSLQFLIKVELRQQVYFIYKYINRLYYQFNVIKVVKYPTEFIIISPNARHKRRKYRGKV